MGESLRKAGVSTWLTLIEKTLADGRVRLPKSLLDTFAKPQKSRPQSAMKPPCPQQNIRQERGCDTVPPWRRKAPSYAAPVTSNIPQPQMGTQHSENSRDPDQTRGSPSGQGRQNTSRFKENWREPDHPGGLPSYQVTHGTFRRPTNFFMNRSEQVTPDEVPPEERKQVRFANRDTVHH